MASNRLRKNFVTQHESKEEVNLTRLRLELGHGEYCCRSQICIATAYPCHMSRSYTTEKFENGRWSLESRSKVEVTLPKWNDEGTGKEVPYHNCTPTRFSEKCIYN